MSAVSPTRIGCWNTRVWENHFSIGFRRSCRAQGVVDGRPGRERAPERLGALQRLVGDEKEHVVEGIPLHVLEVEEHLAPEAARPAGRRPPPGSCQGVVEVRLGDG